MNKSSTVIYGTPWRAALQVVKRPWPPERAGFFSSILSRALPGAAIMCKSDDNCLQRLSREFLSATMYLRDRLDLRRRLSVTRPVCKQESRRKSSLKSSIVFAIITLTNIKSNIFLEVLDLSLILNYDFQFYLIYILFRFTSKSGDTVI